MANLTSPLPTLVAGAPASPFSWETATEHFNRLRIIQRAKMAQVRLWLETLTRTAGLT